MRKLIEDVTAFCVVYGPAICRASITLPGWLVGFLVAVVLAVVVGPSVLLGAAALVYIGSVWVALDEDLPRKFRDKQLEYAVARQAEEASASPDARDSEDRTASSGEDL